jgi:urea transport system permease protein
MHFVVEQVLTGLSIGSILLLAALGLAIIYGTIGVINLAHGEFIMLGAYAAWALKTYVGLSLLPGLVLIFVGVGLFGWLVERILLRRLYQRPLDTILATWGIGINADQVYSATFAYGAGLAGLAGAIISPLKSVSPEMGTSYVVDAFMVVVLGGVQSLFGTVISALSLGEVSGVIAFLQNDTIAKAIVLILIISVIRFRPQGLFVAKVRA